MAWMAWMAWMARMARSGFCGKVRRIWHFGQHLGQVYALPFVPLALNARGSPARRGFSPGHRPPQKGPRDRKPVDGQRRLNGLTSVQGSRLVRWTQVQVLV